MQMILKTDADADDITISAKSFRYKWTKSTMKNLSLVMYKSYSILSSDYIYV